MRHLNIRISLLIVSKAQLKVFFDFHAIFPPLFIFPFEILLDLHRMFGVFGFLNQIMLFFLLLESFLHTFHGRSSCILRFKLSLWCRLVVGLGVLLALIWEAGLLFDILIE